MGVLFGGGAASLLAPLCQPFFTQYDKPWRQPSGHLVMEIGSEHHEPLCIDIDG